MKVVILGATGKLGTQAMLAALSAHHEVTAIVRTPSKITSDHDRLTVVQGDVLDEKQLTELFANHDAVVSCLGFGPSFYAITGYTDATKAMVGAMKSNKIKRLVLCHSWYTTEESQGNAPFFLRWTLIVLIKTILTNMRETELWLESECKDIDYTVVRPPGLTNSDALHKDFFVSVGGFNVEGAEGRVSRADVAKFMLDALNKEEYFKKMLAIGVVKE
eukprot:GEMP01049545.1.p1 GENE.GEMP01049545.1~~GEMP01049545.1.p1  ORF type:complete len:218 (+),score=41.70 GEMP01049545.1:236-889(+)